MKKKQKILIVEDDKSILDALKIKLEKSNLLVSTAKNGKIGLDKALKEHPDLVLTDIMMPVMDGLSMIQEIRKDTWGKNAQIIILSVLTEADKVENAMRNGVYDFLVKSDWKINDVIAVVKEKLK
ncbi:MAG TPA: response regulator [bacterium]|nr:response regulator [bacterium]